MRLSKRGFGMRRVRRLPKLPKWPSGGRRTGNAKALPWLPRGSQQGPRTERKKLILVAAGVALALLIGVFARALFVVPEEPKAPEYARTLRVYNHRTKTVMEMDIEEYLVCVVAAEMPATYGAQAVAARTYTIRKQLRGGCNRGEHADICTDSGHCQAFRELDARKSGWGDQFEVKEKAVQAAVRDTAGLVITYKGALIDALYHATSGGHTEDAGNVYANAVPYLKGVDSPGEESGAHYSTVTTLTKAEFVQKIKKDNAKTTCKTNNLAKTIGEPKRTGSGRIVSVVLGGRTYTGKQARALFGLKSTNFEFAIKGDNVIITTYGYGHGVGMSQVGANAMAQAGSTFEQILHHYYTGVVIENWVQKP